MTRKTKHFLIVIAWAIVTLLSMACNIETDMSRDWMTATVDAAIVTGDGR